MLLIAQMATAKANVNISAVVKIDIKAHGYIRMAGIMRFAFGFAVVWMTGVAVAGRRP